jgi:tRNA threonylcarbamoyladenosine biosynthesis protein TsaE
MNTVYISRSEQETERFAARFAESLNAFDVIALYGDLGAGKTAFVRGLARGLRFSGGVSSPTFAIVHEYRGGRLPIFHFDMYRVAGWDDLYSIAFFEYLEMGGVTVVEWSEHIAAAIPEDAKRIAFEKRGENERKITVSAV